VQLQYKVAGELSKSVKSETSGGNLICDDAAKKETTLAKSSSSAFINVLA
jgi:hypothetical protein